MSDFGISIINRSVGCVCGINDCPLFEDLRGAGLSSSRAVNEWLMPEGNRLTCYLYWPPGSAFVAGKARTEFTLLKYEDQNRNPLQAQTIARLIWPIPLVSEAYPYRFQREFALAEPPLTRLWSEAERIQTLTLQDRLAIFGVATEFRKALVERDVARMYDLTAYKFEDRARAEGFRIDALKAASIELYSRMVASPDAIVAPISENAIVLDPIAGNRVFRATLGVGKKLIQLEDEKARRKIDVYVAKINGKWLIVR